MSCSENETLYANVIFSIYKYSNKDYKSFIAFHESRRICVLNELKGINYK